MALHCSDPGVGANDLREEGVGRTPGLLGLCAHCGSCSEVDGILSSSGFLSGLRRRPCKVGPVDASDTPLAAESVEFLVGGAVGVSSSTLRRGDSVTLNNDGFVGVAA